MDPDEQEIRLYAANDAAYGALKIIEKQDGPDWSAEVRELFECVAPGGPEEHQELARVCARYLARRGVEASRVIARIAREDGLLGEAVLLALEHDPWQAGPLIARALVSPSAAVRMEVAAVLALFDRPSTTRLLAGVLRGSRDPIATAECRAALRASRDPQAASILRSWEGLILGDGRPDPPSDWDRRPCRGVDRSLEGAMDRLHARVMPLRARIPRESLAPDSGDERGPRSNADP